MSHFPQTCFRHKYSPVPNKQGFRNKIAVAAVLIGIGLTLAERQSVEAADKIARFERTVVPHMDAAYNLARWLTRNDHDAQDVVQEAYLRAFRFFEGFRGGDSRAWLLRIVRNTCYTWLQHNRPGQAIVPLDENAPLAASVENAPDTSLLRAADEKSLRRAIEDLPAEFREVFVLRELEGLSYKEIASAADVPMGTVMSRLARARQQLRESLTGRPEGESGYGLRGN